MNEDDTVEYVTPRGDVHVLDVGIDYAIARTRGDYLSGAITVERLEQELERLLRKQDALRDGA